MKILIALTFCIFFFSEIVFSQSELKWFQKEGNFLLVQAPVTWHLNKNSEYFSLSSPDDIVSITASAYRMKVGDIDRFAKTRFEAVDEPYTAITKIYKIQNGYVREYEGTWPGNNAPTYYAVAAVQVKDIYVSITVVTDKAYFLKNKKLFLKIIETIRIDS